MSHTAIVTGGTRGIGAAISVALSEDGHKVAATYAGNDEAAEAFKTQTGISVYRFDVADFDQCADSVSRIETDLGAVGILVNNAATALCIGWTLSSGTRFCKPTFPPATTCAVTS